MRKVLWIVIIGMSAAAAWSEEFEGAKPSHPLSASYGFLPPELYKLDHRTTNLLARDVDGDGKLDLVIVNNLKNRIDVLAQRGSTPKPAVPTQKTNNIEDDQRLEHRKIPVRRAISSLDVRDVNGDGKPDLVYLGNPAGLYVEYQQKDGTFGQDRVFENPDVVSGEWAIDVADLNGDNRADIAFLGRAYLYLVIQDENGRLKNPKRFRLGQDGAGLLRILDVNGDGRVDIAYFAQASEFPFRVRFQEEDGSFGPERRMRIDPPRGVAFANIDGKPGQELLAISSLNNRFSVYSLDRSEPNEDHPTSQVEVFPFDVAGPGKSPDLVVADFDGDGRVDVVASDVDSSQLSFFPQTRLSSSFPCMLGTEALRTVDVDQDKRSSLLSLSSKDKSIAVSRHDNGRLTFPQAIPTTGEPMAMEVLGSGEDTRIVYVSKSAGEGGKAVYSLFRLKPAGKGDAEWVADSFGEKLGIAIELESKPIDLRAVDVNSDGRMDLILLLSFKPPAVLLGNPDGSFHPAPDASKGTLGNLASADLWFGPLTHGETVFLAAQDNFARSLQFQEGKRWKVLDQYNASSGSAKVKGVAVIDVVGDATPEIVMYDRASQSLVFLRMEEGVYRPWHTLKVGAFDVRGMRTADFNGDGSMDLLLYDGEKMGIVYSRTGDFIVRPIASYESDNKDCQLFDMVPGDLNGDGKLDVLLLDPMDHNLEIVTFTSPDKIDRALRWQVFEEKSFNREASGTLEPREAVIADTDGDGLDDIALLVHDRVLIYRQDTGEHPSADPKDAVSH